MLLLCKFHIIKQRTARKACRSCYFSFHAEAGGEGGIRSDKHRAVAVIHDHAGLGPVRLAQAAYRRHVDGDVLPLARLGVVGRKLGRFRDRLVRRLDACARDDNVRAVKFLHMQPQVVAPRRLERQLVILAVVAADKNVEAVR